MKPTAYCDIREKPTYRADAFIAGLQAHGFHVLHRQLPAEPPKPGDVLVIWNRYSDRELTADKWERQGGKVLVAENGYCGRDANGHQLYALAVHGHNGSGTWPRGESNWLSNTPEYSARWDALGLGFQKWQTGGEHILVCPNRHFGMKGLAMPVGWEQLVVAQLRKVTKRPIRVRPHPQNEVPKVPLAADLEKCHAVVIWASSAGVHALLAGVQVICLSPWWILKDVAPAALADVNEHRVGERQGGFQRLAWAQWTVEEIGRGEPFRHLLPATRQAEVAQAV